MAGVFDPSAGTIKLYVDGRLAATATAPAAPWNATGALTLGRTRGGGAGAAFLAGDLADVRVWDRVVTAREVADVFAPASGGRVGDWTMGDVGPGPTFDSSPMGNHLNFWPDASIPVDGAGQNGTGLRLDGVTGYAYTDGPVVNTDQSFTTVAWARLTDTSTDRVVVSQDGAATSGFQLVYAKQACGCWAFTMAASDAANPTVVGAYAGGAPVLNRWTRLMGVYDARARTVSLYVNGALAAVAAAAPTSWSATGVLAIRRGKKAGVNAAYFKGDVDGVEAYAGVTERDAPQSLSGVSANYALDATVTASSSHEGDGWTLGQVKDGVRGPLGWSSSATSTAHTETVVFTFPRSRLINRVDLYPRMDPGNVGGNFPANFTIDVWTGTGWETVVTRVGYPSPNATGQRFTFAPRTTGQVRIQGTQLTDMQFAEVEIYQSSNLAADATASASASYENYGWSLSGINDGLRGPQGWASWSGGNPHWIELAFPAGESRMMNRIDLYPRTDSGFAGTDFPVAFTVEVWTGSVWEPVVQRSNHPQPGAKAQRFSFAERSGSKIRVVADRFFALAEIEVYRSSNVLADATVAASSSTELWGWSLAGANDGHRDGIGWIPESAGDRWVEFTLPNARQVNTVTLYPRADPVYAGNDFPANFTIEVMVGGVWQRVWTETGYPHPGGVPQRFTFDAKTVTKVRVSAPGAPSMAFAEVEADKLPFTQ